MQDRGFIDVHSHVLPGIDDGCLTVADSLQCIGRLMEQGFIGTICTPHVCVEAYPHNTPQTIRNHVEHLQSRLSSAGIEYPLWPGAEVRLAEGTVDWFRQFGIPTLASTQCVLIDYWGDQWRPYCDEGIEYIFSAGLQPVLAHPERMQLDDDALAALLDRLRDRGVWLQGNLRCIAGGEGESPCSRMKRWLGEQRYHMLATDMHRPGCLEARLAGIDCVASEIGQQHTENLLSQRSWFARAEQPHISLI